MYGVLQCMYCNCAQKAVVTRFGKPAQSVEV